MSCQSPDMEVMSMKWLGCHINDNAWMLCKFHGLDVIAMSVHEYHVNAMALTSYLCYGNTSFDSLK